MFEGSTGCALLVIHDSDYADILTEFLWHEGLRSSWAHSAEHALEKLAKETYDVVVTGSAVDGMPRSDFLNELHKISPETGIIVTTPAPERLDENLLAPFKNAEILKSPFALERLSSAIRRLREKRKQQLAGG